MFVNLEVAEYTLAMNSQLFTPNQRFVQSSALGSVLGLGFGLEPELGLGPGSALWLQF